MASSLLILIHTRGRHGRSPIGLNPPSGLGRRTTTTHPTCLGHLPSRSHFSRRAIHSRSTSSGSLSSARGCIPSHPSPVPAGNEKSAFLNCLSDIGDSCSISTGQSILSSALSDAHWTPQFPLSVFARDCAPRGLSASDTGAWASRSCSGVRPSRSSSSDSCTGSTLPLGLAVHPVGVLENRCCLFSPAAGPSLTQSWNLVVARSTALSSALALDAVATSRNDLTHVTDSRAFSVTHGLHAMKAAASPCSCGSSARSLWS